MSCKYFVLTKDKHYNTTDNQKNHIIFLNNIDAFILPQNNIDYYCKNGLFESNLIEWSKQFCNSDKIMLDIGAHTGTYAICLAPYSKHVYAFEPQKMTYYALCGSIALSNAHNITCLNFGLGSIDQVGINDLNIKSNDGGGSTLLKIADVITTEKVKVKTLDSLRLENIGFIKIDIEDNELNALRGAVETLGKSNYPKILFESNKYNEELFNFLKKLGYKISSINGYQNMYLAAT